MFGKDKSIFLNLHLLLNRWTTHFEYPIELREREGKLLCLTSSMSFVSSVKADFDSDGFYSEECVFTVISKSIEMLRGHFESCLCSPKRTLITTSSWMPPEKLESSEIKGRFLLFECDEDLQRKPKHPIMIIVYRMMGSNHVLADTEFSDECVNYEQYR